MKLSGKKIRLIPALEKDRRKVYEWMAHSNITYQMMGPPLFPELSIPTWEEFDDDYEEFMFSEELTEDGHCFIIWANETAVGQINYGEINIAEKQVELDIWLGDEKFTNQGFGTDAVLTLCNWLQDRFACESFIMAPSARNPAAIRSYQKAGFEIAEETPTNFVPDYNDTVILIKSMKQMGQIITQ